MAATLSDKYRLSPNTAHTVALPGMPEAICDLSNAALQQRIKAYRRRGKSLRRLDKAFASFVRGRKTEGKAGFLRFRAKRRLDSAELRVGNGLTLRKSGRLGVPGILGAITVKRHRPPPPGAKLGAAVLPHSADTWSVCFQIRVPDAEMPQPVGAAVGLDVGLSALVAKRAGCRGARPRSRRLQPAKCSPRIVFGKAM
ncbi:MAG TPA: hypothetical protein VD978_11100 [Azospirillum sp.]|nr:hypothetical protein [Azospirillum sp.]